VPCGANINTYTTSAKAGTTFLLGACSYPSQNFTSTVPVTIQGQAGTTIGDLNAHGAQNITFLDFSTTGTFIVPLDGSSGGRLPTNLTFQRVTMTAGGIFLRGCQTCAFRDGSSGNTHDAYSQTIGTYEGLAPSSNILIDNWRFHDMDRSQNPTGHMECLFIQESQNVVVRNATFARCEIFDVYLNHIVGGRVGNVTFDGVQFGATTPSGYYALDARDGTLVVRNSRFDQGSVLQDTATATGCGNIASSNVTFPASLLEPC
jgi:hypothetical protein